MRAKNNLPTKETVRLVDDVTKHNMGLITRLRNCKELESYIFDDIDNKIAKRH